MENRRIVADTSVLIEFLRKRNRKKSLLWQLMERNHSIVISTITVFELYAGAETEQHYEDLAKLLKWLEVVNLTEEVARTSGEIYKELKRKNTIIEFRDIFIGAMAIEFDLPLVTLHEKHFKKMEKLKLLKIKKRSNK